MQALGMDITVIDYAHVFNVESPKKFGIEQGTTEDDTVLYIGGKMIVFTLNTAASKKARQLLTALHDIRHPASWLYFTTAAVMLLLVEPLSLAGFGAVGTAALVRGCSLILGTTSEV